MSAFAEALGLLAATWPRDWTPETTKVYQLVLGDLPPGDVYDEVRRVLAQPDPFRPTPGQIRYAIIERDHRLDWPTPDYAWELCLARYPQGQTLGPELPHPVAATLRAIGFAAWDFRTSERPDLMRRTFIETYSARRRSALVSLTASPPAAIAPPVAEIEP